MRCILSSLLMLVLLQPATAQRKYNKVAGDSLQIATTKVEGGSFDLGDDDGATDRKPAHTVKLKDFSIGTYEVTQKQWKTVMGKKNNPSQYECDDCPVTNVSYSDVQEFIAKLNTMTGKSYRLPTEAEWEYAARGGNSETLVKNTEYTTRGGVNAIFTDEENRRKPEKEVAGRKYSGKHGVQKVAWYKNNSRDRIHEVGLKNPNHLGIHDMSGNAEEWCADWYAPNYGSKNTVENPTGPAGGNAHVVRGGSWNSSADEVVVTYRAGYLPNTRSYTLGFRLAEDK